MAHLEGRYPLVSREIPLRERRDAVPEKPVTIMLIGEIQNERHLAAKS